MSESKTDANESPAVVGRPATATGRRSRADGRRASEDHASDGITITRWSLGLSLGIALTLLTGAFSLVWSETSTLRETQVELVTRVSRLEVQFEELREDVAALREDVTALRDDITALREDVTAMRGELRESVADLRGEIRALGDLIRGREPLGAGAQ